MRVALKIAYEGSKFYGFARQPNLRTIEGDLINSLLKNKLIRNLETSKFRYSSRTDKGVSALGNVVAFNTGSFSDDQLDNLNKNLDNIFAYSFREVQSDFFPRYAKNRIYRYYLKNDGFDLDTINSACSIFTGKHDFSNFARIEKEKNPIRTVENINILKKQDFFIIDFYAQTFLWNQIRRMISAIKKVAKAKITLKEVEKALLFPDIKVDYGLSEARPLILKDVIYNFDFNTSKKYITKLKNLEKNLILSIE